MKKSVKFLTLAAAVLSMAACGGNPNPSSDGESSEIGLSEEEQQTHFEEDYISKKFGYGEGGKFAMSMISSIGSIAAGVAFDSPTAITGGIFSLLTAINDNLNGSSGPTIADVMNKLGEMDTKLDALNDKLDQNYNQLATEAIRTQAMVDQVLLEEQEQAIASFNTDYVVPLENYARDFADHLEQSYKAYVGQAEDVDIYVSKNQDGEWGLVPLMEIAQTDSTRIQFNIPDFANAKVFLEKNYNAVAYGFIDRLNEDIDNAVKNASLPQGLDAKTCRDFVGANLVEKFTKDYYESNHQKALDIRNMAINYAKQINGRSSKSILDRYISRLEYMFNFAGEMKDSVRGALANLDYNLDVNTALASQACLYAGVSQDEIKAEYTNARERVQSYYENVKQAKDNYCFLTHTNLTGNFYRAKFETGYTNKGNHPSFHADFVFENVDTSRGNYYGSDDVNKHSFIDSLDHIRIVTRMGLMKQIGLVKSENYIRYLVDAKVLPQQSYKSYETLFNKRWISNDALRFFTGLSIRDLNDGDRSLGMTCTDAGNPDGDYFYTGWTGTFRGGHDAGCWNGKMAETTYIDAISGTVMTQKKVAAYATYSESHAYWIDDEYWSFVDNPVGNYFFAMEHTA